MKCAGFGIYEGINDQAQLLVWFGSSAADVAVPVGAGMNDDGKSCAMFYAIQLPVVDQYELQFLATPWKLSRKFGFYSSSLLVDSRTPAGTRQLFADLP